jgi:hypothetical protein
MPPSKVPETDFGALEKVVAPAAEGKVVVAAADAEAVKRRAARRRRRRECIGGCFVNEWKAGGLEFEKWAMLEALYTRCYAVTSGIPIRLLWTLDFWISVPHTYVHWNISIPCSNYPTKSAVSARCSAR